MAAKSLETPRTIVSPVVSRQTTGSNHIWKTSSGKSDLKSHFTVSQRLGARDEEGMSVGKWRNYSHYASKKPLDMPVALNLRRLAVTKIGCGYQVTNREKTRNRKSLIATT